jgi:hypothetical protein
MKILIGIQFCIIIAMFFLALVGMWQGDYLLAIFDLMLSVTNAIFLALIINID